MPDRYRIRDIIERHDKDLLEKQNVVGMGSGYEDGEHRLVVFVSKKKNLTTLSTRDIVPKQIEDTKTKVVEIGDVSALVNRRTKRHNPTPAGVSAAHEDVTAGTLGAVVKDRETGEQLILSNNHVFADSNRAQPGDPIIQPGPADGGTDVIGYLRHFIPIKFPDFEFFSIADRIARALNYVLAKLGQNVRFKYYNDEKNLVDAALATPVDDAVVNKIKDVTDKVKGITNLEIGDELVKSGRTTGVTKGEVLYTDAEIQVSFGSQGLATFKDQIIATHMSEPGDSGSLVLTKVGEDYYAVGLLFAGSNKVTLINDIYNVTESLNIEF